MNKKTKRSTRWVRKKLKSGLPNQKNDFGNGKNYAGLHLIAEFWGSKIIEDSQEIERILVGAAKEAGNIPLKTTIHKFSPQGITGVILLAESHIAIHYWPEINYLAIDIFTCGDKTKPYKALEYLRKKFNPQKFEIKKIKRGILSAN